MLPILHLNGDKIANPAILARISHGELESLFLGYGYQPLFVEGDEPEVMHKLMAETVDAAIAAIRAIQRQAREGGKYGEGKQELIRPCLLYTSRCV